VSLLCYFLNSFFCFFFHHRCNAVSIGFYFLNSSLIFAFGWLLTFFAVVMLAATARFQKRLG